MWNTFDSYKNELEINISKKSIVCVCEIQCSPLWVDMDLMWYYWRAQIMHMLLTALTKNCGVKRLAPLLAHFVLM